MFKFIHTLLELLLLSLFFLFIFLFFASVHPSDQKAAFAFLVLLLLTKISPADFALEQFTLEEFECSLPSFTSVSEFFIGLSRRWVHWLEKRGPR